MKSAVIIICLTVGLAIQGYAHRSNNITFTGSIQRSNHGHFGSLEGPISAFRVGDVEVVVKQGSDADKFLSSAVDANADLRVVAEQVWR